MNKRSILVTTVVALLGLCYLAGGKNNSLADLQKAKPDDFIGARMLTAQYGNNDAAAREKQGEYILVFGEIYQVSSLMGKYTIELRGDSFGEFVICMIDSSQTKELSNLRKGMNVRVRGKFDKTAMGSVILKNCFFNKVG